MKFNYIFSLILFFIIGAIFYLGNVLYANTYNNDIVRKDYKNTISTISYQKTDVKQLNNDEEFSVLVLAGQSNMKGKGLIKDIYFPIEPPRNIKYFIFDRHGKRIFNTENFGPELMLSQKLYSYYPDKNFIIIKYAIRGSSLLDWSPTWSIENTSTGQMNLALGPLYDHLLREILKITSEITITFAAILWMQGEKDALYPKASKDYFTNLSILIDQIRKDINIGTVPFLLGQVNPPATRYTGANTVRSAQLEISHRIDNTYLINTDDLSKLPDGLHYDSNGQIELGLKFFEKLKPLIPID